MMLSKSAHAVTFQDVIKDLTGTSYNSTDDFIDIFNKELQSLSRTPTYEYYNELDDDTKQQVMEELQSNSYDNIDDMHNAFTEKVILNAFYNAETKEKAYEVLRSNNDILRIHFSYTDEKYINSCKKMLKSKKQNSIQGFVDVYEDISNIYIIDGAGGGHTDQDPKDPIISDSCGENLSWNLTDGILTISGTGKMLDFSSYFLPPWNDSDDTINRIIIGNGVESIGSYAFSGCYNITEISIPDNIAEIGGYAFEKCTALKDIDMPEYCTYIGYGAFKDCENLQKIVLPKGIQNIGDNTFDGCENLEYISVPDGITYIGNFAFYNCFSLKEIYIPDSVKTIYDKAFRNCTLIESVIIPDSVTSIGEYAFEGCTRLKNVTIPASISNIGTYAFSHCSNMKNVTVCNSLMSPYIFNGCIRIETATFTDNISEIKQNAFNDCVKLTDVRYNGDSAQWDTITVSEYNDPLINSAKTFGYETSFSQITVSKTDNYDVFSLEPSNIPFGSTLIFACYKDGRLMHTETRVYKGENPVYFVEYNGIDYNSVKLFIWSGLNTMTPLGICLESDV